MEPVRRQTVARSEIGCNMSDDEHVAIQRWQRPTDGAVIYVPEGQDLPDTVKTLEQDGLIVAEGGKYVVRDPHNVRVICWQLTVNADARRRGLGDVFTNLPADLIEIFPGGVQ